MTYAVISYLVTVAIWIAWGLMTASRERSLRGD